MKKYGLMLVIGFAAIGKAQAQTFAEWFQQNKTQKKYLIQQIAALQAYIGFAKTGYNIAGKGLNLIGDIKSGDFNLHSLYFSSLKAVNPAVKNYPRVADILTLQGQIVTVIDNSKKQFGTYFAYWERDYISGVYQRLQNDCSQTLDELDKVTKPGKLEMKDDERLKRIDELFKQSQRQYGFAQSFASNLRLLAASRQAEQKGIETIKKINGLQ